MKKFSLFVAVFVCGILLGVFGFYLAGRIAEPGGELGSDNIIPPKTYSSAFNKPGAYTIIFEPAGGVLESERLVVMAGANPESLPVPKRSGYRFTGWYKSLYGATPTYDYPDYGMPEEQLVRTTDVSLASGSVTLYARWEPKPPEGVVDRTVSPLPILMYHNFSNPERGQESKDVNMLDINTFRLQLQYFSINKYYYPSWEEVYAYINGDMRLPEKSVVITVDDCSMSFISWARPYLNAYKIPATSFVITNQPKITPEFLDTYRSPYINFQSHSDSMHDTGNKSASAIMTWPKELVMQDLRTTIDKLGGANTVFCYPLGGYNEQAKECLTEAGFKMAVTVDDGKVRPGMDPLALPRIRISEGASFDYFMRRMQE
jgi:uncharacterized repeat protein (TIGR02543 family)